MENLMENIEIVILAGGQGKRMESELPKVMSPLKGGTMIIHILNEIKKITEKKPIVVVGYKKEILMDYLGDICLYAHQDEQLGTGHAVSCAEKQVKNAKHILVMSGDQPFIKKETIEKLIKTHLENQAKITLATTIVEDFEGFKKNFIAFGRIKKENGIVKGIKEFRDATLEEREIKEVNAGLYMFEANFLWENLSKLRNENAQGEYYLTDLLKIASQNGEKISDIQIENYEALGANTKEELNVLENLNL